MLHKLCVRYSYACRISAVIFVCTLVYMCVHLCCIFLNYTLSLRSIRMLMPHT
jgi:hypothetical protein